MKLKGLNIKKTNYTWSQIQKKGNGLESDHTPSGLTLGGPNTGSIAAVALLGNPGENVAKVGTILPLPYQPLCQYSQFFFFFFFFFLHN